MPMTRSTAARVLTVLLIAASLAGCSTWKKVVGEKADYKQSRVEPPLEIPPDLSSSTIEEGLVVPEGGTTTLSEYAADQGPGGGGVRRSGVLVQPENMHIERSDDKRWLVVNAPPEAVWPKVRDFWLQAGFILTVDDPAVGILETDWAENRADIPQDFIRRTIGRALNYLYSAATRDRFRVRLERTATGGTEVFIAHRGMEEVLQGGAESSEGTIWKPRPSDPELEAEMLRRMMVFMGVADDKAAAQIAQPAPERAPRSQLLVEATGATALRVNEGFSRAWREVGLALDRVGFTVEDRDRSGGLYFVRYNDPLKEDRKRGFLSKLKFWGDDEPADAEQYRILLSAEGDRTLVTVQNSKGERDNSPTAKRILTLVHEQMQ
ncbi:MAG: outer membrane protein assembly factor BamC [Gammaproteobacteria bacterium]|nr:outer membrane protein assembly factor BamC [Gammaproteobacteria bacterium]